ncbi:protein kinase [Ruania sp. N2-46]|uniref:non-specific serine/threonine protein kinase n=1 Tax=Occultella gossypii TaxID=2800820 RepID=A0ABS7S714_9MICO|nr:protein kinase [Occultella gossypii]
MLVDDLDEDREGVVLKIARDKAAGLRLGAEARVLREFDHPRIVELLEGPIEVNGRQALVLSDAGRSTLADRLSEEGRATIEQLENYGRDFLESVEYLESVGVFHRDIKPGNLGIAPDRGTRKPRLSLFDLSLASVPLEDVTSGTPGYVDPFLGQGRRRQYDRAAELYAVSVTLFEMATGDLPTWRDGDAGPASERDRVVLMPEQFDPAIGPQLVGFFTLAFDPVASHRFANAADLGDAWRQVFAKVDVRGQSDAQRTDVQAELDARAVAAGRSTPLTDSGLSARALSALARLEVATVGELIARKGTEINSIPGLGEQYRREIQARVRQWRSALLAKSELPAADEPTEPDGARLGVEVIAGKLIPAKTAANSIEVQVLTLLLGRLLTAPGIWPTTQDLAKQVGASRLEVEDALDNAARRWRAQKTFKQVHNLLVDAVVGRGGVIALHEAAAALTFPLGSTLEGDERTRAAAGLVRAVVEADVRAAQPRLITRRLLDPSGDTYGVLIALAAGGSASGEALVDGDLALDLAEQLGARADGLVAERDVTPAGAALGELRATLISAAGDDLDQSQLDDDHLLRLAVSAAKHAAASSRGEVYRRGLDAREAVLLALRGVTTQTLTKERVHQRVLGRFPEAADIPDGPTLDELVTTAVPSLKWDGEQYSQRELTRPASSTATMTSVGGGASAPAIDRRLTESVRRRSALTLTVHPSKHAEAITALRHLQPVQVLDVGELVVHALRSGAAAHGANWDDVANLDSHPAGSQPFSILQTLARESVTGAWKNVASSTEPLLLVHAGPLARYGLIHLLAEAFDLAYPRPAARWLLVPRRGSDRAPTLDGHPAPLGPDGWVELPTSYLHYDNLTESHA